jgi:signal transduction histidine kinase
VSERLHLTDSQLRELLHLISHDLRNPLAAIVTNLEFARRLVSRMSADPDLIESIDDSVTASDVLRRIVSNFDLLVRGRDTTVTPSEFVIAQQIKDVVRRCEARAHQAEMTLEITGSTGIVAMLDKMLFSIAIENLLSNSIQHAPDGSTIRIAIEELDGAVRVAIRDEGKCISEDMRERALSVEGHNSGGREEGTRYGRGLGLLSVRAAAAACGMTFEVGSISGKSEMSLTIPLGQGEIRTQPTAAT